MCACVWQRKERERERMSCDTTNHLLQSLHSSYPLVQVTIMASLYPIAHPSDFLPYRVSWIQPTDKSGSHEPGICYDLQRLINHHLWTQKISSCLLPVHFLFLLLSYHFRIFFPRSFQESPIVTWGFACQWVRSSVFSNTSGPLFLIQHFTSTVSTFPFSCCPLWVMLNSDPSSSRGRWMYQVPRGPEMHFSCPEPLYQKAESKVISKEEKEGGSEWASWEFKRALNFPAIECNSLPKISF